MRLIRNRRSKPLRVDPNYHIDSYSEIDQYGPRFYLLDCHHGSSVSLPVDQPLVNSLDDQSDLPLTGPTTQPCQMFAAPTVDYSANQSDQSEVGSPSSCPSPSKQHDDFANVSLDPTSETCDVFLIACGPSVTKPVGFLGIGLFFPFRHSSDALYLSRSRRRVLQTLVALGPLMSRAPSCCASLAADECSAPPLCTTRLTRPRCKMRRDSLCGRETSKRRSAVGYGPKDLLAPAFVAELAQETDCTHTFIQIAD